MEDQPTLQSGEDLQRQRLLSSLRDALGNLSLRPINNDTAAEPAAPIQELAIGEEASAAESLASPLEVPENKYVINALESTRTFIRNARENIQDTRRKARKVALAASAVLASFVPVASAAQANGEKKAPHNPGIEHVGKKAKSAEAGTQGTGGYPYANVAFENAGTDPWNNQKRQCTSYVAWHLSEDGVATLRFASLGLGAGAGEWAKAAQKRGEQVDEKPAVGSVLVIPAGRYKGDVGHVAYVKQINEDGSIVIAQYNADPETPGTYTEEPLSPDIIKELNGLFIHFEKKPSKKLVKNLLSQVGSSRGDYVPEGMAMTVSNRLESKNGKFNLIMQWDGNLVLYDQGLNIVWQSNTTGSGARNYKLNKGTLSIYTNSGRVVRRYKAGGKQFGVQNNGTLRTLKPNGQVARVIASVSKKKQK